jgi:protein gp37
MSRTKIEWSDFSWNPIVGCSKISEGCQNCYAEKMASRLATIENSPEEYIFVTFWPIPANIPTGWNGKTAFVESALEKPLRWKKPRKIFVCSMGDLFHESVPFDWIDKVMAVIALCPQHTFQILTKRPERMAEYFTNIEDRTEKIAECSMRAPFGVWDDADTVCDNLFDVFRDYRLTPLDNLWLGITAETQQRANERIPILKTIPAVKHFVSCEPLLSEIDFRQIVIPKWYCPPMTVEERFENKHFDYQGLDWVIVGGETGHNARPCKIEWIERIVEDCKAASVPVFVKQITVNGKPSKNMAEWPEHLRLRDFPKWPQV